MGRHGIVNEKTKHRFFEFCRLKSAAIGNRFALKS